MAPQWMPQNIQKRLFLHVLQQLSLFSQIDLQNVDVSLGSKSQITLTDVQLDTDAFQIPGVHIRNGTIQNFKLELNVSGGVNVEGDGLSLTLSLASSSKNHSNSLSHSELNGEKSLFSLAQSKLELANSILMDDGTLSSSLCSNQSFDDSLNKIPIEPSPASGEQPQSTLNTMISKAVEVALSKLNVCFKNINLRIVLDYATVDAYIDSIKFITVDGIKKVELSQIAVVGISPSCDPGVETSQKDQQAKQKGNSSAPTSNKNQDKDGDDNKDNNNSETDDSDNENDAYESMTTSSILERPQNNLSQSQATDNTDNYSSIYMSATSNVFESRVQSLPKATKLMFITRINIEFEGSLSVENLNLDVDEIRIASSPVPYTLLHIIESLGAFTSYESTHSRYLNVAQRLKEQKERQSPQNNPTETDGLIFGSLKVGKIVADFESALTEVGDFYLQDSLKLVCEKLEVKQKDSKLIYGNLHRSYFMDQNREIGGFQGDQTRFDIRFEYNLVSKDFTLLLPKNLEINLNQSSLQSFIKFSTYIPQILDSINKLSSASSSTVSSSSFPPSSQPYSYPHPHTHIHSHAHTSFKTTKEGQIIIQTSFISLNLCLSSDTNLKLKIAPVSYDSTQSSLAIKKIQLFQVFQNEEHPLVNILNTSLQSHKSDKQVRSYDNNGHEIMVTTGSSLSIKSIELTHDMNLLTSLIAALGPVFEGLDFPKVQTVFKTRKKARIASNLTFQTRQAVDLFTQINSLTFWLKDINEKFGDINGDFNNIAVVLQKDGVIQLHVLSGSVERNYTVPTESDNDSESLSKVSELVLQVINPDDKSSPIISAKVKAFKEINVFLRNISLDYFAKWLDCFNDEDNPPVSNNSSVLSTDPVGTNASKVDVKMNIVDCGIGLNPTRLKSKAMLVIPTGTINVSIMETTFVKSELRSPSLLLIDDVDGILTYEEAKKNRNIRAAWTQATFLKTRGFSSVAKANILSLDVTIEPATANSTGGDGNAKNVLMDIDSDSLNLDLCADSAQCLTALLNDLKQPIIIKAESKYRLGESEGINVFDGVEENAFNGSSVRDHLQSPINTPLNIVDSYYNHTSGVGRGFDDDGDGSSDLLDKDFSELTTRENPLEKNPFYTGGSSINIHNGCNGESKSETSDSIILFNDGHFEENRDVNNNSSSVKHPMILNLSLGKVTIKIYDGYDWRYTRKSISNAVVRLEKRFEEEKSRYKPQHNKHNKSSPSLSGSLSAPEQVIGETLFDSIHVGIPINIQNPSELTSKINKNLQNLDDTIDVGEKNKMRKLKLRRSKFHKVLIELNEVQVKFILFLNQESPTSVLNYTRTTTTSFEDHELMNELDVIVKDFEITDNVPSSTWNKFVTLLKEVDREDGSSMLKLNLKTVRPVVSLAATELLLNVELLPLRLHVDQDTLEVLIRFGEFKDSRFILIEEEDDIPYIQKFHINAIPIKLDYKPKKVDYSGLRSGRTTELMNFFILDEASMVLKELTLYGVSGFPRLGILLNDLWTPDIKQTQLSGVLAGLAPVRSLVNIGSGFKDLVIVPINEYKKDKRIYRSISKGVQQFTLNTTNELLKFGIKIAAGTQTFLENTEEALGGVGSSARIPIERTSIPEESEEDEDDDWNLQSSQLIGRSAPSNQHQSLHRSIYQPTLESIADINEDPYGGSVERFTKKRNIKIVRQPNDEIEGFDNDDDDDESQRTISLYANQPKTLKEGLLLAYDSLGRNFLVAKDAILNAGHEISERGTAHETTLAVVRASPVALLRPIIGATEATSRALLGINNQFDPNHEKYIDDKYKQMKK